ncbi:HEPN domain-containing protein [Candidatus Parabeggiatoa sp. HSG14]|uniref:HEPN domain-containing protein n=1 Tax=Candidatus Parabeggiatoa sp. HSG14 TaxID=3055593 RepID=UPI0032E4D5D4
MRNTSHLTKNTIMYQEKLEKFKNIENLAGKSWEHAVAIDVLATTDIKDCSIECFHYQQMVELFFKYLLETKSQFGSYSKSHKLQKLLEEVIAHTKFRTDKTKYFMALQVITVCAEEYRYNFLLDCEGYRQSVTICDQLIDELLKFENEEVVDDFDY